MSALFNGQTSRLYSSTGTHLELIKWRITTSTVAVLKTFPKIAFTSCWMLCGGEQVMLEIKKNNLHVYELPPCDEDEDETFKAKDKQMKAMSYFFSSIFVSCDNAFTSIWSVNLQLCLLCFIIDGIWSVLVYEKGIWLVISPASTIQNVNFWRMWSNLQT